MVDFGDLQKPSTQETQGQPPFTITDFLSILKEPVTIQFLADELDFKEEVQRQLSEAHHFPLNFQEQRQLIENQIAAEKAKAEKERRNPNIEGFKDVLNSISEREKREDKTVYYGIVRTPEDLMRPQTAAEKAAQEIIISKAFSRIKWPKKF